MILKTSLRSLPDVAKCSLQGVSANKRVDGRWIKSPDAQADSEADPQNGNRKLDDTDVVVKRVLAKALKAAVDCCACYYIPEAPL